MNFLLRLIPLFVGAGAAYLAIMAVASFSRPVKFVALSLFLWGLGHLFTWYNVFLLRRESEALVPRSVGERVLGHLLMVAGGLAAGGGYVLQNKVLLVAALACIWFADDRLTPRAVAQREPPPAPGELSSIERKYLEHVRQQRKDNPASVTLGGGDVVLERLRATMGGDKGVHTETLLVALGALAGYACQASLRDQARAQGVPETAPFIVAETDTGAKFFYGDLLNAPLAEAKVSVWTLVSAGATQAGCNKLPDLQDMFAHVTDSVGHPHFGVPRVPPAHAARSTALALLKTHWPALAPVARKFCESPQELPLVFAVAAKNALALVKPPLTLETALVLVMESAIAMSKIELEKS